MTMRHGSRAATGAGADAWHELAGSRPGPGGRKALIASSHHGHDLERWPLHDTLVLGALESAVPSARAHLRQLLRQWGHAELAEDASIVISELVTNAVVASAELRPAVAPVLMWLGSDRHHVLAAVADASLRPPMRLNLRPDAERGRGLALVEALSSRWGWHPASITGLRKFIWAEWHLPIRADQRAATGLPDRSVRVKPPTPPCRGGNHAGITRARPWPQP